MRIGILTLPLHTNYGGILQAYALQTVLDRMGHEVVVVDAPKLSYLPIWKWPFSYPKRIISYILRKSNIIFYERYYNQTYPIISQHTQKFIDEYINRIEVQNFNDLKEEDFDAIIVGSDQIWRPKYYKKIENAFLDFAKMWKIKRIAYAASFGTDEWEYNAKQTKTCKKLIKLFDAVSVREDSGVILCKKNLEVDAVHVLDPTLLLNTNDYIRLFKEKNIPQSQGDLLCYILDETQEKTNFINKVANEKNLKPFRVNAKVEDYGAPLNERIQPPLEQWLRGFYDAELVITDSFHACVFSIIFNKPFLVLGNKKRGVARIKSLLKLFALEDSLIVSYEEYLPNNLNCNLQSNLEELRIKSYDYLLASL